MLLEVQKNIRRAVQIPLHDAALAAGFTMPDNPDQPRIQWKGVPFSRGGLDSYFAVEIGMGRVVVTEIGKTPRVWGPGFVTIVIRSPIDKGEDGNDALLGIISAAYPYASTPSFGGVSVVVDKSQHRGYGSDGPWLTGLVSVDWNVYRRSASDD